MDEKSKPDPIIGQLNEHTLHLALKNFCEPDSRYHEIPCEGFVADVLRNKEITEIETRSFTNIRKKLSSFLGEYTVTVVYPIAVHKTVAWVNAETGEISPKRKSPKKGRPIDVMYELYKLLPYLSHPHFRLKVVLCDMEEYKRLDGWSRDKKRGSTREDRIPTRFLGVVDVREPKDYASLVEIIPEEDFTATEFGKANRIKQRYAWYALQVLSKVGLVERCGQKGRAFLFRRTSI